MSTRSVPGDRLYGFLITKELIFGFQILDLKDHFLASLSRQIIPRQKHCMILSFRESEICQDVSQDRL